MQYMVKNRCLYKIKGYGEKKVHYTKNREKYI